jgi:serine protease Do
MNVIKTALAVIFLSFVLVACIGDGVNRSVLDAKDAIVFISTDKKGPLGQDGGGVGTGFFIGENVILTNNHVVADATNIKIALESSAEFFEVEVVNSDPVSDLAVVRIKEWDKFKASNRYKILEFADKHDVTQTQTVYSIGHPWGMVWSISRGVISAVDRKPGKEPKVLIQTDAKVYNGNSGGPLLNESGQVLGVNSLMYANEGGSYGFALPVIMIEKVLKDFKKHGQVHWAVLGILIGDDGSVKELVAGEAAERDGVLVGDRIISFKTSDGLYDARFKSLPVAVASHDPDEPLELTMDRAGQVLTLTINPSQKLSSEFLEPSTSP